jgi:hypothetical protein
MEFLHRLYISHVSPDDGIFGPKHAVSEITQKHLKNTVFWEVVLCRSCMNRRFGETSPKRRFTQRHTPEDGIFHSHRCENLKYYKKVFVCVLEKSLNFYL